MILGRDDDLCCRLVRERLATLDAEVLYLAEDQLFPGLRFTWELRDGHSSGSAGLAAQAAALQDVDGVLARFSGIPVSPEEFHSTNGSYLCSEWHALMRGYLQALPCPVINRPPPALWYKGSLTVPELLALAPSLRFRVPRTAVTTRFEDARDFVRSCGNRVRYSPLTMPSNYILDDEEDLGKAEKLSRYLPLYLSEVIDGDAVEAYAVGGNIALEFAETRVETEAGEASEHCRELAACLGLGFCQFHLVRTAAEEWYCLGVDCMPHLFECSEGVRDAVVGHLVAALAPGGNGRRP